MQFHRRLSVLIALLTTCSAAADHGVVVPCGAAKLELAVASDSSFRISAAFGDAAPAQIASEMVAPQTSFAKWAAAKDGAYSGIRTSFGTLLASPSGGLKLLDAAGHVLSATESFTSASASTSPSNAAAPTPTPTTAASLGSTSSALFYGPGADGGAAESMTHTQSQPVVKNTAFWTPHFWSTDGYAALGVAEFTDIQTGKLGSYPATWTSNSSTVEWSFGGRSFDLYLMPGDLKAATSAYYALTGAPKVLPRYAYGFMACRWGWDRPDQKGESSRHYMERMLGEFRNGSFPIDAFISVRLCSALRRRLFCIFRIPALHTIAVVVHGLQKFDVLTARLPQRLGEAMQLVAT